MAELTARVTFDIADFQRGMLRALRTEIDTIFNRARRTIKIEISKVVRRAIEESPEYQEMLPGGELYGQVGVVDIQRILDRIVTIVTEDIRVDVIPSKTIGKVITTSIEVAILDTTYDRLLRIRGSSFISKNKKLVDWLSWLLLAGSRTLVVDFEYDESGKFESYSRTGTGIMRKSYGSEFSFPEEYAGTRDNNWLTRAIREAETNIVGIIQNNIQGRF